MAGDKKADEEKTAFAHEDLRHAMENPPDIMG
jgi:hypothetical protein